MAMGLYAMAVAGLYAAQRRLLFVPDTTEPDPLRAGVPEVEVIGVPTADGLSLLAWYVFAPQCIATLAAMKRETGGYKMPLIAAGYLFGLAYLASFVTYRVTLWMTGGAA